MIDLPTDDNPVVIIHGDCLEILPQIPAGVVDAVVTDPPYGIGVDKMTLGNGKRKLYRGENRWDQARPNIKNLIDRELPTVVWGGNYFSLPESRCWLVWDKGTGKNDFADCELAWTNLNMVVKKFFYSWVGANAKESGDIDRGHPTQKPIALMRWCIQHLPKTASIILDPFAGSGTTGVAAILEGRKAILIEKDAGYVEVIKKRIAETLGRPTTLANGKTVGRNLFESIRQESPCVRE